MGVSPPPDLNVCDPNRIQKPSEMSSADVYDCVVVGAGVQGSFTAYELAKGGRRTVLLEQVRPAQPGLLVDGNQQG